MNDYIKKVNIKELEEFPNNPFKLREDEMLRSSIRHNGVIYPILVRPKDTGGYEIIAGRRRVEECKRVGIEDIPAFIREMDYETAVITLIDSNIHREQILPSEKAFAYKLKLEAIRSQGQRNDLTSRQVVEKLTSADTVGLTLKESGRNVQRYIRLTELIPPVLEMVDEGKIAISPAYELSFLLPEEQQELLDCMEAEDRTPSLSQSQRLKHLSLDGILSADKIHEIMREDKPNQKEQVKFQTEKIQKFFPRNYTADQMEQVILKLLADWQRRRERDRGAR